MNIWKRAEYRVLKVLSNSFATNLGFPPFLLYRHYAILIGDVNQNMNITLYNDGHDINISFKDCQKESIHKMGD